MQGDGLVTFVPALKERDMIKSNYWMRLWYDLKNYGNRGGRYLAEATDNTFLDLQSSLNHTKVEFNNCFTVHSK